MNLHAWRYRIASRSGAWLANALTAALLLLAGWQVLPAAEETRVRRDARVLAAAADGRPLLLVLFQERDCSAAGHFVTDWRRVIAGGEAHVVAVPINIRDRAELARVTAQFPPGLEVRPDLEQVGGALLRRFRAPYTPVAVLLDARGRPRLLIPELDASPNQLEVQAAVGTYLSLRRRS